MPGGAAWSPVPGAQYGSDSEPRGSSPGFLGRFRGATLWPGTATGVSLPHSTGGSVPRNRHTQPPRLALPRDVATRVLGWAAAAAPREGCGLLVGRSGPDTTDVRYVVATKNLVDPREARCRYLLDPSGFLRADRAARARGLEIVGFWHSHPTSPAFASPLDRACAWEGYVYLIVAPAAPAAPPEGTFRAYRRLGTQHALKRVPIVSRRPLPLLESRSAAPAPPAS